MTLKCKTPDAVNVCAKCKETDYCTPVNASRSKIGRLTRKFAANIEDSKVVKAEHDDDKASHETGARSRPSPPDKHIGFPCPVCSSSSYPDNFGITAATCVSLKCGVFLFCCGP